jgi:hypothetical protein
VRIRFPAASGKPLSVQTCELAPAERG